MTERMTAAELREQMKPKGKQRAGGDNARATYVDGLRFDSAGEAKRWGQLRWLERSGEITGLERQVPIPLHGQNAPILTATGKQMVYLADFVYYENNQRVIEDYKGHESDVYKMKKAILLAQGIEVIEVRA